MWRIDGHRGLRYPFHVNPWPSGDKLVLDRCRHLGACDRMRIGNRSRPYRHLCMSRRWLPNLRLRAQAAKRERNRESKNQRSNHNPLRLNLAALLSNCDRSWAVLKCRYQALALKTPLDLLMSVIAISSTIFLSCSRPNVTSAMHVCHYSRRCAIR